jgi:heat shock protein HspQ
MAKYYEMIINDEVVGKLAISEEAIERLNEKEKEEQDQDFINQLIEAENLKKQSYCSPSQCRQISCAHGGQRSAA